MVTQPPMELDAALAAMRAATPPVVTGAETVPLGLAQGRVLARDVLAPLSLPPFAASAMDGFAVAAGDAVFDGDGPYRLPVQGTRLAGAGAEVSIEPDHALRIFTGAPLPERADAVVIQEHTRIDAGHVTMHVRPAPGQHVRAVGNDVVAGQRLFDAGHRLEVFDLGQLAACGVTAVPVRPLLRVAVFSTGDELQEAGRPLASGQIYDANRFLMTRLLSSLPVSVTDLGILPDAPGAIDAALTEASQTADVVLTSGGVSVGDADHVRSVVQHLGELRLWRVAIKPGKPLAFGRIGRCAFFGLPGNPVSTIVTLLLLVKPALLRLAGAEPDSPPAVHARARQALRHDSGRTEFQRGRLLQLHGRLEVEVDEDQGSNRLASFRNANCLVCIPAQQGHVEAGESVQVIPFRGLLD